MTKNASKNSKNKLIVIAIAILVISGGLFYKINENIELKKIAAQKAVERKKFSFFRKLPEPLTQAYKKINQTKCSTQPERELCSQFPKLFTHPEGGIHKTKDYYLFLNDDADLIKKISDDFPDSVDPANYRAIATTKWLTKINDLNLLSRFGIENLHIFYFVSELKDGYKLSGYLGISVEALKSLKLNWNFKNIPYEWVEPI
jgi:hypothetical protein